MKRTFLVFLVVLCVVSVNTVGMASSFDGWIVERAKTPDGFAWLYNNFMIDDLVEEQLSGTDEADSSQVKDAFHISYDKSATEIMEMPTYSTGMGFFLIFYCQDPDSHFTRMELVGDFSDLGEIGTVGIMSIITTTYTLSIGMDVNECDKARKWTFLLPYGMNDTYNCEYFSAEYWEDDSGYTHLMFERI